MKVFQEIQKLQKIASILTNHKSSYEEEVAKSHIDKYGRCFNGDTRFAVFSVKATFCSHTGSYGSSSCGTFNSIKSNEVAQESFNNYLRENQESIIQWMARDINNKAASLVDKAEEEVNECVKQLKKVKIIDQ